MRHASHLVTTGHSSVRSLEQCEVGEGLILVSLVDAESGGGADGDSDG